MKRRDVIYLLIAVTIFAGAGYIAYTQLLPQSSSQANQTVEVEHVGNVPASLEGTALTMLQDGTKTLDYNSQPDFSGLGNKAPFGQ